MILHRSSSAVVFSTETPLFTLTGPNPEGATVFLENLDSTNYVTFRTQISDSPIESTYVDLPDDAERGSVSGNYCTKGILTPISPVVGSNRVMISIRTASAYTRVLAASSGGAQINFGVVMQNSSLPNNFSLGLL